MLIGTELYYIVNGLCLLFLLPSSICFWKFMIEHDKKDDDLIEKRWNDCE